MYIPNTTNGAWCIPDITLRFSHGSNEVTTAMNPYAALLQLYTYHSEVAKQAIPVRLGCHGNRPREADCRFDSDVSFNDHDKHSCSLLQISVLALGGIGVTLGFALWGWKIVRCIGGGITYLSPSRGFSAQLCALATVLLATKVELPVSALHVLLGSIIGVGLADSMQVRIRYRMECRHTLLTPKCQGF